MSTYFDLILLAALAGFLIFRLFSVLGKYNNPSDKPAKEAKNFTPRQWNVPANQTKMQDDSAEYSENLKKLKLADSQFTEQSFLKGAQIAYETLFAALCDVDQNTIKSLCSPKMQRLYHDKLATRQSRRWISKDELLRILSANITDIHIGNKTVKIMVEFKAEQVLETRDAKNHLVEGDPDQIEIIKERWTFSRPIVSENPNWQLMDVTSRS